MKRLHAICTSLCLFLLLAATPALARVVMYIDGSDQGRIEGDVLLQGEEGNIDVTGFSSSIYVPYDQATGLPSGRRQYSPIVINKSLDKASVPMIQALLTTENLKTVELRFYSTGGQGLQLYYRIEMQNAKIVSHQQSSDDTTPPVETWGFTFDTIVWTDELNGIQTTDKWADVVAAILPPGPSENLTLLPPLPNPTDAASVIRFDLPLASHATLDVYDLRGRRVARLFDRATDHARTVVRWDGRDSSGAQVANGLYLVRLRSAQGEVTQRVTFMR